MFLIIAECAIDLVPESWLNDKKIEEYVKKRHRFPLQDASVHQHLLKGINRDNRLDRPDILHFGLLTASDYQKLISNLTIQFSSKHGIFEISRDTNLPRSQQRFYGILETLIQNKYLGNLIKKPPINKLMSNEPKILFTKQGKPIDQIDLSSFNTFIFGGFSSGSFKETYSNSLEVSLHPSSLSLWTSISLLLSRFVKTGN